MSALHGSASGEATAGARGHVLRALPPMLKVGFSAAVAYRGEFLIWILSTNMPLVMLLLWSAVAAEAPVGRFGEAEFAAYFLATLIVRLLTGSWVGWEMNYEIKQGTLSMRLLRPIHPFLSWAAENVAALPMRALVSLPIAAAALIWVGAEQLSNDPLQLLLVPVAIFFAWAITFLVMAFIGTLGLYFESSLAVFEFWLGLYFVFSGYLIPLELMPSWLHGAIGWMPFRYVLSFPVELLLGLADRQQMWAGFATQLGWVAVTLVAALTSWKRGLRRYAAFGG